MNNKERIRLLEEYIATFNTNEYMFFCYMPCMVRLKHKQKLKELRNFRLLEACEDCGGVYKIYSDEISAFTKPSWNFPESIKIYNKWKIEIAQRAIELLSESE